METERQPQEEKDIWAEQSDAEPDGGLTPGEGTADEGITAEEGEAISVIIRQATATLVEEKPDSTTSGLPKQPHTFAEVGLSKAFLTDLTLKIMHYSASLTAAQLMRRLGLSQGIVQELVAHLVEERMFEVLSQSDLYTGNYRYRLTIRGQERATEALERSRYAGPAPVTAEQYGEVISKQMEERQTISRGKVKEVVGGMVLASEVADSIARALFSGSTAIFYGLSGNGKTSVLQRFAAAVDGEVLIPYAIYAHGQVIRIFDPSLHHMIEKLDDSNTLGDDAKMDRRWVRVKRPALVVSTELGPESLDLAYDPASRFYQAPPHIKVQGGILIVDDLGRQRMSSPDLLARWLIALDRGWDTLTLASGEKVRLPFAVQLLLATNLPLHELADDALLRRILYKVELTNPGPEQFADILKRLCLQKRVLVLPGALDYLIERLYVFSDQRPRASYARDLVDIVVESARFDNREPVLSTETLDRAFHLFLKEQGLPPPEDDMSKPDVNQPKLGRWRSRR